MFKVFKKKKFTKISSTEFVDTYQLHKPIFKYVNKAGLIDNIPNCHPNGIDIIKINKQFGRVECVITGEPKLFTLFNYNDFNFHVPTTSSIRHIDKEVGIIIDKLVEHVNQEFVCYKLQDNLIILKNRIYITPEGLIDFEITGEMTIEYTALDSGSVRLDYVKIYDKNQKRRQLITSISNHNVHQYIERISRMNKRPQDFLNLESLAND